MSVETDNPFEKVLDRLRDKGWCKRKLGGKDGPNCLNGGIWYEAHNEFTHLRDYIEPIVLAEYANRVSGPLGFGYTNPEFNNHPDTTFADVERVLEKAAVKWEEERVLRD